MNNKLSIITLVLLTNFLMGNAYSQANTFEPSPSPIFNIPQPKPNILILFDDSNSMNNRDVYIPEHAYGFGLPKCDLSGDVISTVNDDPNVLHIVDRSSWSAERAKNGEYDPFINGGYEPWDNDKAVNGLINGKKRPPRLKECKLDKRHTALDYSFKEIAHKYKDAVYLGVSFLWQVNDDIQNVAKHHIGEGLIKLPIDNYAKLTDQEFQKTVIGPVSQYINNAHGNTPMYPAVYEVIKMFRGQPVSAFGVNKRFTNFPFVKEKCENGKCYYEYVQHETPLRYRCQENHLIVMTDGVPNDYTAWGIGIHDGITASQATAENLYINNINQSVFSTEITANKIGELTSKVDLRNVLKPILRDGHWTEKMVDDAGKDWNDEFSKAMPIITHSVSLFVDPLSPIYVDMTAPTNGMNLGFAKGDGDAEDLMRAFDTIFASIIDNTSSTLSVNDRPNANVLEGMPEVVNDEVDMSTIGAVRYDTTYNFREKFGNIRAISPYISHYQMDSKGYNEPIISVLELWNTDETIKENQGRYLTFVNNGNKGLKFEHLTDQNAIDRFNLIYDAAHSKNSFSEYNYMDWLVSFGKPFPQHQLRTRLKPMGSVTNSDIILANKDQLNINVSKNYMSDGLSKEMIQFVKYKAKNQPANLIIVSDNDGFINFINAQRGLTGAHKAGERNTAYFPQLLVHRLDDIAQVDRSAKLVLEGKTNLVDAKVYQQGLGNIYATIGMTGTGAGGKGLVGYRVYAAKEADVKSGKKQNASDLDPIDKVIPLFEITNEGPKKFRTKGFENLGYMYSGFEFFNRVENGFGQAVAVFGNGFGVDRSILYFVDAYTGEKLHEINLGMKTGGASKPAIVVKADPEGKGQILSRIYVGDYSGNMYRINFESNDYKNKDQTTVTLLFRATTEPDNPGQSAIFVKPLVTSNRSDGSYNVSFGTGIAESKALDRGVNSLVEHSIYSVIDKNMTSASSSSTVRAMERSTNLDPLLTVKDLKQGSVRYKANQSIDYLEEALHELEITTPVASSDKEHYGWAMRLIADGNRSGERTILSPKYDLLRDSVVFSTLGIFERNGGSEINGLFDPCLADAAFGKILSFDLKTGEATSTIGSIANSGSTNSMFGGVTGPGLSDGPEGNQTTQLDNLSPSTKDELKNLLPAEESSYVDLTNGVFAQCKGDTNAEVVCVENRPQKKPLQRSRVSINHLRSS